MLGYSIYKCCLRRCATRLDEKHLRDNFYHIDDSQLADEYIQAQDSLKHSRQNLQPFFEALRNYQIGAMLKEEKVCREILGINRFSDETLLKLKDEAAKRKRQKLRRSAFLNRPENKGARNLQGAHTYRLLALREYCDRFMYLPYSIRNRKTFTVSMYKHERMRQFSLDVVRCVTDLAFMPTKQAREMEFNPEYLFKNIVDRKNAESAILEAKNEDEADALFGYNPDASDKSDGEDFTPLGINRSHDDNEAADPATDNFLAAVNDE